MSLGPRSFALALCLVSTLAMTNAGAATFVVNTTADTADNVCDLSDCSIKDAMFEADATPQADVIELQPGALYVVSAVWTTPVNGPIAYPQVTTPIVVNGHGATLERSGTAPEFRFFQIEATGALTLNGLTVVNGGFTSPSYHGGAILSFGALTVDNAIFRDNHLPTFGIGGAIYTRGTFLQVTRSTFSDNRASVGGALTTDALPGSPITTVIDRCSFYRNKAIGVGSGGGGVFLRGEQTVTLGNSTFVGNISDAMGGAIVTDGIPTSYPVDLVNVTIVGNSAQLGGGLYPSTCTSQDCPVANKPRLTNTILTNNFASQQSPNCHNFFESVGHNIHGYVPNTTNCVVTGPLNPPDYTVSSMSGLSGVKDTGDGGGLHLRPSATSLPVDNGLAAACSAGDQLELSRQGPVCDIGAIEYRPCLAPPTDMSAWWPFDEYAGRTGNDISGSSRPALFGVPTPPTTTKAMVGRARCFDGSLFHNAFVQPSPSFDVSGDCALGDAEAFTIDVWLKTAAAGHQPIVDKRWGDQHFVRGYELYLQDGTLGFQMATGAGSAVCETPGSACTDFLGPPPALGGTILNDDRWHHVAVVVDRCNDIGEMYVDGALEHTFTPRTGDLANDAALFIADSHSLGTAPQYFTGCLDELEFFKRALSAAEVAALYDAGWAGKCKPPSGISIGGVVRCVTALHKGLGSVAAAQRKVIRGCVKDATKRGPSGAGACLIADAGGRVARAIAKAAVAEPKQCDGVVTELGPESAAAASDAAVEEVLAMTSDVLGADLDGALATAATDAAAARCQADVLARAQKLLATELNTFERCVSLHLKHGSADPATLAGCAADPTDPHSIAASAQSGGNVASATAKLAATAAKECNGVDIATRFPNACAAASAPTLGACVEARVECRVCRMLTWGARLAIDCDAFDDGVANASCG